MKKVWTMLVFVAIIGGFIYFFEKHNENMKKKEFNEEILSLVKNAKLNAQGSILNSNNETKTIYGFGSEQTDNHKELDFGRSPKQYKGGIISVDVNKNIEAVFYNDKWCGTYNQTTTKIDIKPYDSTCILPKTNNN